MAGTFRFVVEPAQDNLRLDLFLAWTGVVSRTKAKALLAAGAVQLNRHRVKVAGRLVHTGDKVELFAIEAAPVTAPASLHVLWRSKGAVVVDKPAGLPVQGTRETDRGTLLEAVAALPGVRAAEVRVVHRLDVEASGAVVVALTRQAAAALSAQMQAHAAERRYVAAVEGDVPDELTLRHYLTPVLPAEGGRGPARVRARGLEGDPGPDEREAVCHVRCVGRGAGCSLVTVQLETGRAHQIRAQLSACGHPLVGDTRYGAVPLMEGGPLARLALHAWQLQFDNPEGGARVCVVSPLPADLSGWLEAHGLSAAVSSLNPVG